MKLNLLCGAIALATLFSASAGAQTCASPDTDWHPNTSGSPSLSGSTCGHETGIISTCQTNFGAPGAAYVALINVALAGTFTNITYTNGAGYSLAAYFVPQASGCNTDAACTATGSAGGGAADTLHADLPPGQYYMIITGADFDAPGACGDFTATANGTLPVTLQSFSVG